MRVKQKAHEVNASTKIVFTCARSNMGVFDGAGSARKVEDAGVVHD